MLSTHFPPDFVCKETHFPFSAINLKTKSSSLATIILQNAPPLQEECQISWQIFTNSIIFPFLKIFLAQKHKNLKFYYADFRKNLKMLMTFSGRDKERN